MSAGSSRAQREITDAIFLLWRWGTLFGGVIDAGCAEGSFALWLAEAGPARTSTVLNIDAQDEFREPLEAISATMKWHHRICALADKDGGTVTLLHGSHPYWSSLRPADDPYWSTPEARGGGTIRVPRRTIDSLVAETRLPGPYFIKLDVQGAEAAALRGARRTLRNTEAVLVEVVLEDFAEIHQVLHESGFLLFDVCAAKYAADGTLCWFYATYIPARRRQLLRSPAWDGSQRNEMIELQERRRREALGWIAQSLERYRAGAWPTLAE